MGDVGFGRWLGGGFGLVPRLPPDALDVSHNAKIPGSVMA